MKPQRAIAALRFGLRSPLPRASAWARMLPPWAPHLDVGREDWREASVLLLLHPLGDSLGLPLVLRSEALPQHKGQVGLPGGAREAGEALEETALRETEEEIGVPRGAVEILGTLSRILISRSGFSVLPFVGWTPVQPSYSLQRSEVDALFEAPLSSLLEEGSESEAEVIVEGELRSVPCYSIAGRIVWGATAMILSELARVLEGVLREADSPMTRHCSRGDSEVF